jgi:hypothetical protein
MKTVETIKITVEEKAIELPSNWIPAQVAREIATSISNEYFKKIMDNIMEEIKSSAEQGKTSVSFVITSSMNSEILARIVGLLTDLEYRVSKSSASIIIYWY